MRNYDKKMLDCKSSPPQCIRTSNSSTHPSDSYRRNALKLFHHIKDNIYYAVFIVDRSVAIICVKTQSSPFLYAKPKIVVT